MRRPMEVEIGAELIRKKRENISSSDGMNALTLTGEMRWFIKYCSKCGCARSLGSRLGAVGKERTPDARVYRFENV